MVKLQLQTPEFLKVKPLMLRPTAALVTARRLSGSGFGSEARLIAAMKYKLCSFALSIGDRPIPEANRGAD